MPTADHMYTNINRQPASEIQLSFIGWIAKVFTISRNRQILETAKTVWWDTS